jgi:hypothetical protein
MEVTDSDKTSRLLQYIITVVKSKGPGLYYKTLYGCNKFHSIASLLAWTNTLAY